jgi:hypothetical protein
MTSESASLYFRAGTSDKVYQIWLEPEPDIPEMRSWRVRFAYGRRLATLRSNFKIRRAPFAYARQIYDKSLLEKLSKGYRKGPEYTKGVEIPPLEAEPAPTVRKRFEPFARPTTAYNPFEPESLRGDTLPTCGYCGQPVRLFFPDGTRVRDTRYCSARCAGLAAKREAARTERAKPTWNATCSYCGRAVRLEVGGFLDETSGRWYCSGACRNADQRRGAPIFRKPLKSKPKPVPRPAYEPPEPPDPLTVKPRRRISFNDE